MSLKFSILNFEFSIPTHPRGKWGGRVTFKIQNSKFKIQDLDLSELTCCN
jgi:hypothetical protein